MAKVPFSDSTAQYVEYLGVLKRTRRLHTFGTFYNAVKIVRKHEERRCPFCGSRLIADGFAYKWEGQARLYWWMKKLKREGPSHADDGGPPEIPAHVYDRAADVVGYPGCYAQTGNLPDEYHAGFFHELEQKGLTIAKTA
jgi:hypothetical protein